MTEYENEMNDLSDYNYNDGIREIFKSDSKLNPEKILKEEFNGFQRALRKIMNFFRG